MANIISIFNLSQNSGKTITAYYLAKSLASLDERVLLIDTCSKKGLNKYFFENDLVGQFSLIDFFEEIEGFDFFHYNSEKVKFSFIPYEFIDDKIENQKVFRQNLSKIESDFDYIIFDTSSFNSLLNDLVFSISSSVLIPIETEFYGLDKLVESLEYINNKQILFSDLKIEGLLLNRFTKTNKIATKIVNQLKESFESLLFQTIIPRSFLLSFQIIPDSLKDLKKKDLGYQAYNELALEIINKKTISV